MHLTKSATIILITMLVVITGCSGGGSNPTSPAEPDRIESSNDTGHTSWGIWQFRADPVAKTLDITPLRGAQMHLNALPFLEPPALLNLTLETLEFNGNIIDADIGLRHPFLGLTEFSGFDVCGILISNGSITGFDDPGLRMAGDSDTRITNPDGLARWWNPAEFPVNLGTMFSYNDGLLGAPDSVGNFNCTLNGYKYFCDSLMENDPLDQIDMLERGLFSAGQKNVRHYTIELGNDGLVFNYAIDANWQFPNGDPPFNAPDDFPAGANRVEAYRISIVENMNTLWNDGLNNGGGLSISIDVFDWFNAGQNSVKVESPGSFPAVTSPTPTGGGMGYSTYEIEIENATPSENTIELLITVESEDTGYGGLLPGKTVSAYFTYDAGIGANPPATDGLVALADADVYEIGPNGTVQFNGSNSYDDNGYQIVSYEWDFGDSSPTAWVNSPAISTHRSIYSM